MRYFPYISLIAIMLFMISCRSEHADVKENLSELMESGADSYTVAYTCASYLSGTKKISPEEAIPMLNKLIALGYPTAARYCIDNLERSGIHSSDLLALRGLCYQHELQPELAESELKAALAMDPENDKIQILINNLRKQATASEELPMHETLFRKGIKSLQNHHYDSAYFYITKANEMEVRPEYEAYKKRLELINEGGREILSKPGNYQGYMLKSQNLSALRLFQEAQKTLDEGLIACPENLNLILAKALVWVQEGKDETARLYLLEQEQQGTVIDPAVKQKIFQQN